ncbi:MAG: hypothetical protein ACR2PG_01130, partial [Hyphomicrobiaceae bacterium]
LTRVPRPFKPYVRSRGRYDRTGTRSQGHFTQTLRFSYLMKATVMRLDNVALAHIRFGEREPLLRCEVRNFAMTELGHFGEWRPSPTTAEDSPESGPSMRIMSLNQSGQLRTQAGVACSDSVFDALSHKRTRYVV